MAIARAFLSHSSLDKKYVERVAKRLGRQQVQFDKWAFEVGQDFYNAITDSLNSSATFVLFASKASLDSFWVKFEVRLAQKLLRNATVRSSLVFIIDPDVKPSALPRWMQKSLVKSVSSANAAARDIQYHLNRIRGFEGADLFFGRNSLLEQFADKLVPSSGSKPPHILVIGGLEGVGRRTFIRHALRNSLSMQMGPVFHLRRTDGIDALHIALVMELGDAEHVADLATKIGEFRRQSPVEKANTLAALLNRIGADNVAPCIVDDGALLSSSSQYKPEAIDLIRRLEPVS